MINANPQTYWIKSSGSEGGTGLKGSLFPYWSFTKTVIAICTLKLREEAIVDLDAPIDGTAYTLRHLLAHTSGLPDYSHLPEYARAVQAHDVPWARDEMLALALSAGLLFEPGQGWSYSNIGYMFVRDAIEAATGQSLGQLVRTMICLPLGLQSIELASTQKQFAKLHWADSASYDPKWVYHGCLIGTGADAARVLHGLISGDLLRPESVKQMTETTSLGGPLQGRPWSQCGYALGLMSGSIEGLGRAVGHSGSGPFCASAVYHFPDAKDPVTVASFTDHSDEGLAEFAAADHVG